METLIPTDPARWRLNSDAGDHHWLYVTPEEAERRPQSTAEKHFLGLPTVRSSLKQPAISDPN